MARPSKQSLIQEDLKRLGLVSNNQSTWELKAPRQAGCWQLQKLNFVQDKSNLEVSQMHLGLNAQRWRVAITESLQKHFPDITLIEVVPMNLENFWCLVEFNVRPDSGCSRAAKTRSGFAGLQFKLYPKGSTLCLAVTNHFAIGKVPDGFLSRARSLILKTLNISPEISTKMISSGLANIFEIEIKASTILQGFFATARSSFSRISELIDGLYGRIEAKDGRLIYLKEQSQNIFGNYRQGLGLSKATVDVLEARMLAPQFANAEGKVIGGDREAFSQLLTEGKARSNDLFFIRRACLLQMFDRNLPQLVEKYLEAEPQNILFLSYLTNYYYRISPNANKALDFISRLGRSFRTLGLDIENLKCFDVVFPEVLGDLWASEDIATAKSCYQRVLAKRGRIADVLMKLSELAAREGDRDHQIQYLRETSEVLTDASDLAEIYYQIAKVYSAHENEAQTAVQYGLECLQRNPDHLKAVLLTTDLLISLNQPHEALEILGQAINESKATIKTADRIVLENRLGAIWLEQLGRPDLARVHFEKSYKLDEQNMDTLSFLERAYRSQADNEALARVLDEEYKILQSSGLSVEMENVKQELMDLYSGKLGKEDKAFDLYLNSEELGIVGPDEIAKILKLSEEEVDWRRVHDGLHKCLQRISDPAKARPLRINLAMLCRKKLDDDQRAVKYLLDALQAGPIDQDSQDYLFSQLLQAKRFKEIAKIYENLISQSEGDEKKNLIKRLLRVPDQIDEVKRDENAYLLYKMDPDESGELSKRFEHYGSSKDLGGIERLLEIIDDSSSHDPKLAYWLELAASNAIKTSSRRKFQCLDNIVARMLETAPDRTEMLRKAVTYFEPCKDLTYMRKYAGELLHLTELPNLSMSTFKSLFREGSLELAIAYDLKSDSSSGKQGANYAKKAAKIYASLNKSYEELKAYCKSCLMAKCMPEDLAYLRALVTKLNAWDGFVRVLVFQANRTDDRDWKIGLLEETVTIYLEHLADHECAKKYLREIIELDPDNANATFKLIELSEGHMDEQKKHIIRFLSNSANMLRFGMVRSVLKYLEIFEDGKDIVKDTLGKHLDIFASAGEFEIVGRISEVLLQWGVQDRRFQKSSFRAAIDRGDQNAAFENWKALLENTRTRDEAKDLVEWTKKQMTEKMLEVSWADLANYTLVENLTKDLLPDVLDEIEISCGLGLFHSDESSDAAFKALQAAFERNERDARVWVPLYLMLREFADDRSVYEYLRKTLPQLRKNKEAIKPYPITLELLESEFERLSSVFMSVEEIEDQAFKRASGDGFTVSHEVHEASQTGSEDLTPVFKQAHALESSVIVDDWRHIIKELYVEEAMTAKMIDRPFPSEVEKHVALQAIALLSGEMDELNLWHWRIWRQPDEFGYPLKGRDRYPNEETLTMLQSPLHKLILHLSPVFVRLYPERFRKQYLTKKLSVSSEDLEKSTSHIGWRDEFFENTLMKHYADIFDKQRFKAFDLKGLGSRIFYEGESRSVYVDKSYYARKSGPVVFHRIYGLLWAVKLNYFVALQLDPNVHVYTSLKLIRDAVFDKNFGFIKSFLGMKKTPIAQALDAMDRGQLERMFERAGDFSETDINALWSSMRDHIYRLLIAETLDLVGVFESICGRDLVDKKKYRAKEILDKSPFFEGLLEFCTLLKI